MPSLNFVATHLHVLFSVYCECYVMCVAVHFGVCVINDMCDVCCLFGMPGTSDLLSIAQAPIEMAYQ